VWKVKLKKTNEFFALKEMSKTKIIDRRSETSIMSERTLLSKLNNPFIVNMYFAFQDYSNLYLVMDLLSGGDLRYHLSKKKKFSEKETKFFISNIILALEYIHSKNVIHRDIKPENLVLELNGYLRITDFGVAKINEKDNSSETSGTPGYMAPEVILVQNHSFASDFFALGVIGYEFMLGYRPYIGRSRKEIKELIIYKQARINEGEIPYSWTLEAGDFINKLLKRKPVKRLGYNGIKELKSHVWMRDINWNALKRKELIAPFIPNSNRENFDKIYCEKIEDIGRATLERYKEYSQSELFLDAFKGYTYVNFSFIKSKYKKYKNSELKEKKGNDKEDIKANNLIKSSETTMKKNYSMIIGDQKYSNKTLNLNKEKEKFLNSSNSQKNIGVNLSQRYLKSRNIKFSNNNKNQKEGFKRYTGFEHLKSAKNNNNKNKDNSPKKKEKTSKIKYSKELLKNRKLNISVKMSEIQKNKESTKNKEENQKIINKSNSMKMLNINVGVNMNYNFNKVNTNKTNKKRNLKINSVNNIKTTNKNNNNHYNDDLKKPVKIKGNYHRIFSPKINKPNININKTSKNRSAILNHHNDKIKKNKYIIEINKKSNQHTEKTKKENNENIINVNKNKEIKANSHESKIRTNNKITNDFNIKRFENDNYNEPRSKVMLWIQKSHPINQQENKSNKLANIENKAQNNNDIKGKINNSKINQDQEIKNYSNSPKSLNDYINNYKIDINKIIKKEKPYINRPLSQKSGYNSFNRNTYRPMKIDTNYKYKTKKNIVKKKCKSSNVSKRNFFAKNNNISQTQHYNKSNIINNSIKSKSPKNTFLVFNTININLGDNQNNQKKLKTPKVQVIRNIDSSIKDTYIKNQFFIESMPYFTKKNSSEKEKFKYNNNNNFPNTAKK